jgi:hypothetical protein
MKSFEIISYEILRQISLSIIFEEENELPQVRIHLAAYYIDMIAMIFLSCTKCWIYDCHQYVTQFESAVDK